MTDTNMHFNWTYVKYERLNVLNIVAAYGVHIQKSKQICSLLVFEKDNSIKKKRKMNILNAAIP